MRRLCVVAFSAIAALAFTAAPSQAQTNWAGPYVGANAGAAIGQSKTQESTVFSPVGYFAASSVPAIKNALNAFPQIAGNQRMVLPLVHAAIPLELARVETIP